jgi:acyl-[acyl-carrier-protein] desaturase
MGVDGIIRKKRIGWANWVRAWTAEENRHGDLLKQIPLPVWKSEYERS